MQLNAIRSLTIKARTEGVSAATDDLEKLRRAELGLVDSSEKTSAATATVERSFTRMAERANPFAKAIRLATLDLKDLQRTSAAGLLNPEVVERETARIQRSLELAEQRHRAFQRSQMGSYVNDNAIGARRQNLGYQMQDIGVSAISGMPLGMIAAQQGSQIFQAYAGNGGMRAVRDDLRAIGAGAVSAGASLAGMLGTTGLIATGFGAVAVAAGAYYFATREGSADVAARLEKEDELIRRVAKSWADAAPAIKAYVDELDRKKALGDLDQATAAMVGRQYEDPRAAYPDLRAGFADAILTVPDVPEYSDALRGANKEYRELTTAMANATATGQDALDVQQRLMDLYTLTGIPSLKTVADSYGEVAKQIDAASKSAREAEADRDRARVNAAVPLSTLYGVPPDLAVSPPRLEQLAEERRLDADMARRSSQALEGAGRRPNDIERLDDDPYPDIIKSGEERIRQLAVERDALALTGSALERYRFEQDLITQALRQNIELAPEQIAAVHKLGAEYIAMAESDQPSRLSADLSFEQGEQP